MTGAQGLDVDLAVSGEQWGTRFDWGCSYGGKDVGGGRLGDVRPGRGAVRRLHADRRPRGRPPARTPRDCRRRRTSRATTSRACRCGSAANRAPSPSSTSDRARPAPSLPSARPPAFPPSAPRFRNLGIWARLTAVRGTSAFHGRRVVEPRRKRPGESSADARGQSAGDGVVRHVGADRVLDARTDGPERVRVAPHGPPEQVLQCTRCAHGCRRAPRDGRRGSSRPSCRGRRSGSRRARPGHGSTMRVTWWLDARLLPADAGGDVAARAGGGPAPGAGRSGSRTRGWRCRHPPGRRGRALGRAVARRRGRRPTSPSRDRPRPASTFLQRIHARTGAGVRPDDQPLRRIIPRDDVS